MQQDDFSPADPLPFPDPVGPPRHRELAALLSLAVGLLVGWSALFYLFGALLLVWEAQTGLGKADLSLGLTGAILASAVVAPVAGKVIDAGAGRLLLPFGALLGAVGLLALSQATSHRGFLLAWIVIGAAQGCSLYEATFTFLARVLRQRARRSIALVALVAGLSTSLVYPVASEIADGFGWRKAVVFFAGLSAYVAAPLMYFGAATLEPASCRLNRTARAEAAGAALRHARGQPVFWCLLVAFACLAFTEGLVLAHGVPALVAFGHDSAVAILVLALLGPFQAVARIAILCARVEGASLGLMVLAVAAMGAGLCVLLLGPQSTGTAFAFMALFGLGYGLTPVLKPVVVSDCLGYASIGAILGCLALPYYAALALAPYLGSILWEQGGYALALKTGVAGTLLCMAGLIWVGLARAPSRVSVAG
ncbi:MFS transporter [Maribius pontilimi]|uniref:MFS transporter n=1 Tax=Palleronia pontilimi TaxID=1964209 RepID=A0A934I8P0_9RHOB|nr:MFS transporter [Palleronia pontilimi]MBJ3762368.1 MFS transporter [Palleronia pontilimi]